MAHAPPKMADPGPLGFDPHDVGFIGDPYPVYVRLREAGPIHYFAGTNQWLVSRYEDVNALLRDRRFGRTYHHVATDEEMGREPAPAWHDPFWDLIEVGVLDMEPPNHARVRRLVAKAFTPRYVEGLRPTVEQIMGALVEDLHGAGEFDLLV